jgi:hypothetical protein
VNWLKLSQDVSLLLRPLLLKKRRKKQVLPIEDPSKILLNLKFNHNLLLKIKPQDPCPNPSDLLNLE